MTIKELIDQQNRIRELIEQDKKSKRSPLDIFEELLSEMMRREIEKITPRKGRDYFTPEEIADWLNRITPRKGVHYFDGEKGVDGADGLTPTKEELIALIKPLLPKAIKGEKGDPGKDGKNLSPKEAKMILAGLLKELKPEDIGALDEEGVATLLSKFEKRTGKSLEARLNALQDAVMRNYGGHGGSRPFVYDLSPSLDGTTKTFTVDNHSKIISITSSSVPFTFRPTVDYTDTATSITFDSSINAPSMLAAGQSIVILMIP